MSLTRALISSCVLLSSLTIGSATKWNDQTPQQQVWSDNTYKIFERYEKGMNERQIRERLDGLAIQLKTNPPFRAHIMAYGGHRSCRGEAQIRARLAKDYLAEKKGIESERIKIFDGGYREEWAVELWYGAEGGHRAAFDANHRST